MCQTSNDGQSKKTCKCAANGGCARAFAEKAKADKDANTSPDAATETEPPCKRKPKAPETPPAKP